MAGRLREKNIKLQNRKYTITQDGYIWISHLESNKLIVGPTALIC